MGNSGQERKWWERGWRRRGRPRLAGEDGSVIPFVVLVALAAAGLAVAVGRVGADAVASARAQASADAAALAGAAEGEGAARRLAEGNGGRLLTFATEGHEVQVTVEVGGAQARARAERGVAGGTGSGVPATASLTPEMRAAIASVEVALGRNIPITSGWRSSAAQQALWDRRATNPYPVARPGTSSHERGTAIDVPVAISSDLARVGPSAGLCQPLPVSDPVHFELCGPRGRAGRARPRRRPVRAPRLPTRSRSHQGRRPADAPVPDQGGLARRPRRRVAVPGGRPRPRRRARPVLPPGPARSSSVASTPSRC